jgi:membrane-associated phospholipid phosphatase
MINNDIKMSKYLKLKITNIWDIISFGIVLGNLSILVLSFYNPKWIYGMFACGLLEKSLKLINRKFKNNIQFLKRPPEACDCSLFNNGGNVGGNSGFPSGHCAFAAYFGSFIYFNYLKQNINNLLLISSVPLVIGIARYYKKCHKINQILAGFALGGSIGYIVNSLKI